VKLIKLKRTQTVFTEKERKREKTERNKVFLIFFSAKKLTRAKKNIKKNKKNALSTGFQGWGALSPWCQG
jgi:hypothetical protein